MLTKKEISEALALSCVESYFLAWLKRYYDVKKLYGNSFVGLKQVFDDFSHGAMYQNYCDIPRLQDIAEENGIVEHKYHSCGGEEAIVLLNSQPQDALCLIRVNTAFFTGFKRSSWREDHYICVDKDLKWINQYPLSEGAFTKERFLEVYDGAVCIYRLADTTQAPTDCIALQYKAQDFSIQDLPKGLGELESAIGILRVSRKRLEEFFAENTVIRELLHKENVCMDKIYFQIHLRRLKENKHQEVDKIKAYSELYEQIEYLIEREREIARALNS